MATNKFVVLECAFSSCFRGSACADTKSTVVTHSTTVNSNVVAIAFAYAVQD